MFTAGETVGITAVCMSLALVIGTVFGSWVEKTDIRYRLIQCGAAEYQIDAKTGDRRFVIFAEEGIKKRVAE